MICRSLHFRFRAPLAGASLALLLAAGLGACASDPQPVTDADPSLACEVKKCVCVTDGFIVKASNRNLPVQWEENGAVSCPAGTRLAFAKPERVRYPGLVLPSIETNENPTATPNANHPSHNTGN